MADPFIEQIKSLCREQPIRAKWVFVPNAGLRWTLAERLLHEGCNWVNLRLVTPLQMALESAAPGLIEQGIHPCPETLGPSLLQNLLLQSEHPAAYFRPLILQPGMAEALWRTLYEFRLSGLRACDIKPISTKMKELKSLFQAYEDYLKQRHLADRAMVLETDPPPEPLEDILIYPYCRWSPLEQRWLSKLAGHLRPAQAALEPPKGWLARQVVAVSPPQPAFFWANRRSDEIDEVAWRLRQAGTPLDQVEIVANSEDDGILFERLAAHGFPCTFESGLPMLQCRPGQALDGILSWFEHGLTAYHLRELLQADLLRAQPGNWIASRLLEAAGISWGRETYHRQLQILAEATQRRAARQNELDGLEQKLGEIEALKDWLRTLFQRMPPANLRAEIQPHRWLTGLQETLSQDFQVRDGAEEGARKVLLRTLEELKLLPGEHWPLPRFLPLVRQRIRSLRALASRPRAGHIHITRPEAMGLCGRPIAFWIGLEEGRLLRPPVEDCVLSDLERAELHPELADSSQTNSEKLFHIRERLLTFSGTLTLSYARHDQPGDQEQIPAWLFLEAVRKQHPAIDTYEKLSHWLGSPAQPPRDQQQPHPTPGAFAEAMRRSKEFTIFDGFVPAAAGLWDPRQGGPPISASRLKALATCPFQVFLELGLGLQSPPLQLPDSDTWLDPATRGTILHDIYAYYHRSLRCKGWRPDRERDRGQLLTLLEAELEAIRATLPPPSEALEKSERRSLQRDLLHFLHLEVENSQRRPIALEVPFGMGQDAQEPLAHPDPVLVEMEDGQKLAVRGRIDRIDQIGDHYAVVDYKTGKSLLPGNPVYDRGRLLQHALYAMVAEQMLAKPGKVKSSSYYFPTKAAARPWYHFPYPQRNDFFRVLNEVLEPLKNGAFAHTHESDKDCRFCHFRAACEAHLDENQKAKLDNPANTMLASRRRLLEEA